MPLKQWLQNQFAAEAAKSGRQVLVVFREGNMRLEAGTGQIESVSLPPEAGASLGWIQFDDFDFQAWGRR
jgi:hypothetical protein